MEILFWGASAGLVWHYLGYPVFMYLRALPHLRGRNGESATGGPAPRPCPPVSVVLPVRNEARWIEQRVTNLLEQDYPGPLDVIVVANGCTDATLEITTRLARERDRLCVLHSPAEEGKAGALNRGVAASTAEIIVFADARQAFESSAVHRLVSALSSPEVGAASGALELERSDAPNLAGIAMYWDAERFLRQCEGITGSTVGATGAIYAIRRRLFIPLPPGLILDDVYIPLKIVLQGYRSTFVRTAIAYEQLHSDPGREFRRKLRTLAGNYQLLRIMPELLRPDRNPLFFRFISHRVLRLGSPFFLLILAAGFILPGTVHHVVAILVLLLALAGGMGLVSRFRLLSAPAAFLLANAAAFTALFIQHREAGRLWGES